MNGTKEPLYDIDGDEWGKREPPSHGASLSPAVQLSGGGAVTPEHTDLKPNGQQKGYVVLTPEERAKGFVRPVRDRYVHVGIRPKHRTRPLTEQELRDYGQYGYACFEVYPASEEPVSGRFWTQAMLNSGCFTLTRMSRDIAETYARDPKFYGGTFCIGCGKHLPVEEFVWVSPEGDQTEERLGT